MKSKDRLQQAVLEWLQKARDDARLALEQTGRLYRKAQEHYQTCERALKKVEQKERRAGAGR
jgi:hypothetical protein